MDATHRTEESLPKEGWTVGDARALYGVEDWGGGFFDVGESGHVQVRPMRDDAVIDLKVLVDELQARGIQLPILLRFSDILESRLVEIHDAFGQAIEEYGYASRYQSAIEGPTTITCDTSGIRARSINFETRLRAPARPKRSVSSSCAS